MWPFVFIFSSEIADAAFAIIIPMLLGKDGIYLLVVFWLLQFISAPLQGGFSDNHCRKKSLLFAFLLITIANIFLLLSLTLSQNLLLIGIVLYAVFGNVDVISRAALLDIFKTKNRRIVIAASFISQTLAWILVAISLLSIKPINVVYFAVIASFVSFLLSYIYFEDPRDLSKRTFNFHIKSEIKDIFNFFKKPEIRIGIIAFFLLEVSYYLIDIFHDTIDAGKLFSQYTIYFGSGYIFGLVMQMLSFKNEKRNILIGIYLILIASCLAIIVILIPIKEILISLPYFLYSIGLGMTVSSFYSLFSKHHGVYQEGKLFGVFASIQTCSVLIPAVLFSLTSLNILEVHMISLFLFLIVIFIFNYLFKNKRFSTL